MRALLFLALIYCCRSGAQDSTIVIKAGNSFNESVPVTELFQYPQFSYGKVFFRSGDSGEAKLNYHKFLDEMQFIDPKGDTLNLANPGTIRFIRIITDIFYYDNGYMKLVKEINGIKLAVKNTLRLSGRTKIGAYNMESPTSAIDSYSILVDQRTINHLVPREDITLSKKTQYYFGDKYNQFTRAFKKNLLKQFSKHSAAISKYLKDNDTDLSDPDDLEKLLQYLGGL